MENSPGPNTGVGSLSLLQGIFPRQGSNPGLPHCRRILFLLSHEESPIKKGRKGFSFVWELSERTHLAAAPSQAPVWAVPSLAYSPHYWEFGLFAHFPPFPLLSQAFSSWPLLCRTLVLQLFLMLLSYPLPAFIIFSNIFIGMSYLWLLPFLSSLWL